MEKVECEQVALEERLEELRAEVQRCLGETVWIFEINERAALSY